MSKTKYLILAIFLVAGLSFAAIWVFNLMIGDNHDFGPLDQKRTRVEIEDACRKHLREADQKAVQAIAHRSSELSDFINSRKPGAKPFSNDIVSLRGKWRALKPYLLITDKEGHKKYVEEKFGQHIFTNQDLAAAVTRTVEGTVKDLEGIENELAVALRQEIHGRSLSPDEIPIAAEEFKKAMELMVSASQRDAAKTAGSLVASEVAAQVGAQVLVRLGMSAGIIATCAANSWWSCGAALVIGFVVDFIWEKIDNPAGDIEREVIASLDKLSLDLSTAINAEMNKIVSQRSELWNKTVKEVAP